MGVQSCLHAGARRSTITGMSTTDPCVDDSSVPSAAYLHLPFCAYRCGYCNFTVSAGRDDLVEPYLDALERELSALELSRPIRTLFIGGGTPTHLPLASLARLLDLARRWFVLAPEGEFSVEANPSDLDAERVAVLADHGVTRVSLGAQSFNPAKLARLERQHAPADVVGAVDRLRTRVASISLDLIFGAPRETLPDWRADVESALHLAPDHVSTYGLTYERGTAFWSRRHRGDLQNLDEELERAMYEHALDRLTDARFEHYEVSNFARAGHRCRHNETYWAAEPYYGVGAGAARYVSGCREVNHRSTTTYIRRVLAGESPVAERESLGPEDRAREALVLGLRRLAGVDRGDFERRTGFVLEALVGAQVRRFVALGMLADDGDRVRLTRSGLLISDSLWPSFLRR